MAHPHKAKAEVLADLVARTRGDHGKWFAVAKSAGLFDEAIAHARCEVRDPGRAEGRKGA